MPTNEGTVQIKLISPPELYHTKSREATAQNNGRMGVESLPCPLTSTCNAVAEVKQLQDKFKAEFECPLRFMPKRDVSVMDECNYSRRKLSFCWLLMSRTTISTTSNQRSFGIRYRLTGKKCRIWCVDCSCDD